MRFAPRKNLWRPAVVVAAAVSLLGVAIPAMSESSQPGTTGTDAAYAVFNEPNPDGSPDFAIEDHIIKLVNETPAGEDIYGAMFSWTREPVAQALADAQARGVNVRLAIDGGGAGNSTNNNPDNAAINILKDAGLTELVFCEGPGNTQYQQTGCIADREYSINHNKLFSFSATGDMTDVVLSASQNMTNSQGSLFNNAVVVPGDTGLYDFFTKHFTNLLAQKKNNNYFNSPDGYYRTDDNNVTAYFSPRADSSGGNATEPKTDTYNLLLGYIKDQSGTCKLDIVHAEFTDARVAVADQLVRLAGLGCDIRLVYGSMGDKVFSKLSGTSGIELKRFYDSPGDDSRPVLSVHSKYIDFTGDYNGTPDRHIVFTGSQNLTGPSLRNHDETLLKVEIPKVADAFDSNFETVWSRATCQNPNNGECP